MPLTSCAILAHQAAGFKGGSGLSKNALTIVCLRSQKELDNLGT